VGLLSVARKCDDDTRFPPCAELTARRYDLFLLVVVLQLCKKKIALPAEDCTPEEVHEEFTPLAALLGKQLNSPLLPLRHVAQACYLTVARSVWASDSTPARELLASSLSGLFQTYATKKNTRIAPKFIEDLLVNRLSDIAVPLVWGELVTQLNAVQHTFLRGELTHLYTAVVKKYHGLASEAQQTVRAHMAAGLAALAGQLTALLAENGDKAGGKDSKRLKSYLTEVKDVADFLKKSVASSDASKEGAHSGHTKGVQFEDLRAVRDGVAQLSAALTAAATKFGAAAQKDGASDAAEGATEGNASKAKKQSNKQSGVAGQITAVQASLAAFITATAAAADLQVPATPAAKSKKDKSAGGKTPSTAAPASAAGAATAEKVASSKTPAKTPAKGGNKEASEGAAQSGKKRPTTASAAAVEEDAVREATPAAEKSAKKHKKAKQ
jgi:hypothetical protein